MTSIDAKIDAKEAASALSDIASIAHRVRQSRTYNLASLMLIMWGGVSCVGYLLTYLSPHTAGYTWVTLDVVGIAGWIGIAAVQRRQSGVRTFDLRMLAGVALFVAFGLFTCLLGQFGSRQLSTFWPIYFMMVYSIVGLWVGTAFVAIGLCITALTLIGYFFVGASFDLWMAFVDGGGLILGGLWMRRE
jgi:hypothetical protein